jgi:hypothetical protein
MRYQFATSVLALSLVVAGCVTDARIAEYRAELDQQCRGYGFKPDTPEFSNCLMQADIARKSGPFCSTVRGVPVCS